MYSRNTYKLVLIAFYSMLIDAQINSLGERMYVIPIPCVNFLPLK
jgi:hypothetical protein